VGPWRCQGPAVPVLAHRLLPSPEAQMDRRPSDQIVAQITARLPVPGPQCPPRRRGGTVPLLPLVFRTHPKRGPMRSRRTLTARGMCMLVFGGLALAAGLVIGQLELVGVGVLLITVPLLFAFTVIGSVGRIAHSRTVLPVRVPAGHDARVMVRVGNSSTTWPIASVFVEDFLPVPLSSEPRYFIGHLGPRAVRDITYLVRPAVRGRY